MIAAAPTAGWQQRMGSGTEAALVPEVKRVENRRSRFRVPPSDEPWILGYNCDEDASPFFPAKSVFAEEGKEAPDSEPSHSATAKLTSGTGETAA